MSTDMQIGPRGGAERRERSSPRTVIRGESPPVRESRAWQSGQVESEAGETLSCGIDWCAFTFVPTDKGWPERLLGMLDGASVTRWSFKDRGRGFRGYASSADLGSFGLCAWGGEHQRGTVHVELTGDGCSVVRDWDAVVRHLADIGARLTRVDIRADDFSGARFNVEWARRAFAAGEFDGNGRPPEDILITSSNKLKGQTYYVGSRAGGKLFRCYEKGRQQGRADDPWTRVEVEWRAKDRVLSGDMLLHPVRFLAGAYRALHGLWGVVDVVRTVRRGAELSLGRLLKHARQQAGKLVNVLVEVCEGDLGAVVELIRRDGRPARLAAADAHSMLPGLLMEKRNANRSADFDVSSYGWQSA